MGKPIVRVLSFFGLVAVITGLFFAYLVCHEGGHALAVLMTGGRIETFSLTFVMTSADPETAFAGALIGISGTLLPLFVFLLTFVFYRKDVGFNGTGKAVYHFFFFSFAMLFAAPVLFWVFLFAGYGDDTAQFIRYSGVHPLIVAVTAFAVFLAVLVLLIKKGLFKAVSELLSRRDGEAGTIIKTAESPLISVFSPRKIFALAFAAFLTAAGILSCFVFNPVLRPLYTESRNYPAIRSEETLRQPFIQSWHFTIGETGVYSFRGRVETSGGVTAILLTNDEGDNFQYVPKVIFHIAGTDFSFSQKPFLKNGKTYTVRLHTFFTSEAFDTYITEHGLPFSDFRHGELENILKAPFRALPSLKYSVRVR